MKTITSKKTKKPRTSITLFADKKDSAEIKKGAMRILAELEKDINIGDLHREALLYAYAQGQDFKNWMARK